MRSERAHISPLHVAAPSLRLVFDGTGAGHEAGDDRDLSTLLCAALRGGDTAEGRRPQVKAELAINYDAILKGVRRLERVNPQRAKAVEKIVKFYLDDERKSAKADRERGQKRSLESRLLKAHPCKADRHAGFTQLPAVNDVRSWRCEACGATVSLDGGA